MAALKADVEFIPTMVQADFTKADPSIQAAAKKYQEEILEGIYSSWAIHWLALRTMVARAGNRLTAILGYFSRAAMKSSRLRK